MSAPGRGPIAPARSPIGVECERPIVKQQTQWVHWLYELLARESGRYPLGDPGLPFSELPLGVRGKLRCDLADSIRLGPCGDFVGEHRASPFVPWDEVCTCDGVSPGRFQWVDAPHSCSDGIDVFTAPYSINLSWSDREILNAVERCIRKLRKVSGKAAPRARRFRKPPPWEWVRAMQERVEGRKLSDSERVALFKAKRWLAEWKTEYGESWMLAIARAERSLSMH